MHNKYKYKYHYVYKLINTNTFDERKYYIGVRSCNCEPDVDRYFSSSKTIKNIIKNNGNTFKKIILKVFDNREDAANEETRLHKHYNVCLNKEYYNIVNQKGSFFDTTGIIFINKKAISIEDYNKSELKYHSCGKITVKDSSGHTYQTNLTDVKYINKEVTNITVGYCSAINIYTNNYEHIKCEDFYKNTDIYYSNNKGKVVVKDANNNTFLIDKNDENYLNGNLISVHKGKVMAKNIITGENLYTTVEKFECDPNLVGINSGNISGKNNPNAKTIHIFDALNNIQYICIGNFKEICINNNLPMTSLKRSYMKKGSKIYSSNRGEKEASKRNNEKYIGWYALEIC